MKSCSAIILTADQFEDMEVFFPYFRLLEEGVKVHVAAPSKETIHGEHGYALNPDKTMDEVDPDDYDLLIIPGGSPDGAPRALNKSVASICHGPYTLVSANVIKGRHLTSYWHDGVPAEIEAAGGVYEDKEVVVDGNLITSRWPPDLPAFMREVMNSVKKIRK